MTALRSFVQTLTGIISRLWSRGCIGKLAVAGIGFVVLCACLGSLAALGGRAPQTAALATAEPTPVVMLVPTETLAPTAAPEPTAVPATVAPAATAAPVATLVPTVAPATATAV